MREWKRKTAREKERERESVSRHREWTLAKMHAESPGWVLEIFYLA